MEARLAAEQTRAESILFPDELKKNASHASARIAMQTQEAEFAARLAAIENERKMIDQQMLQLTDSMRGLESNTKGSSSNSSYCRKRSRIRATSWQRASPESRACWP